MLIKHRRGGHTPNSRKTTNQKTNNKQVKKNRPQARETKEFFYWKHFFELWKIKKLPVHFGVIQ
jgi:hypothetical protein|nr:MAG TPA_asm: hypothetical protein [Caudoviricetes sp.]